MKHLRAYRRSISALMTLLITFWQVGQPLQAATVYWDIDGATAGAGGATPAGTWDGTNTFWNSTSGGTGATNAWLAGDTAVFAAGTDATGTYTVTVSGAQSIGGLRFEEGAVTLSGGTLQLAADSIFDVATGLTATISSALDGSFALTKTSGGMLDLQGDSTATLLGALNVSGGTLRLSGNGALGGVSGVTLGNRATITLDNTATNLGNRLSGGAFTSNGGTLNFIGNASATTESLGALTLNAGALTINSTPGAGGNTLTLPSITRNAGGTLYVNGTGLGSGSNAVILTTAPTLTNTIVPWAVVNDGTLISFATHSGDGTSLRALSLASHDQTNQGTGWINTDNLRPTTSQTLSGNRNAFTLTLGNGINLNAPTADRNFTFDSPLGFGAILQTGGSSTIGATGAIEYRLIFGANEAIFHTIGDLTIQQSSGTTANIQGSGGLTKSGAGTLSVKTSSMTGTIRLNEGTYLATGSAAALGGAAALLEFNGGNLTLANDSALTMTAAGTITVNAATTVTIDRLTSGAGLVHVLPGALVIGGETLTVVKSAAVTADSNYGLTFNNSATGVTLTGSPTFVIDNNGAGTGTINLNAVNSSGGAHTIIKQGTGNLINNGTTGFQNALNVQGGRVGWSNNTGGTDITESNSIFGAGGIIKSGASTVRLTGTNTYTGTTQLNGGILEATTLGNLGNGSELIFSGGTLRWATGSTFDISTRTVTLSGTGILNTNGNDVTLANSIGNGGAGGLTKTGLGTLVLSVANDYTGATTLNGGVTAIATPDAFGTGTSLVLSSGTLQGDGLGQKTIAKDVTHNTGTFIIAGNDKFVFSGGWLTSGGTRTLQVDNVGGVDLTGTITLGEGTSNRTQVISGTSNVLVSGVIQNNAGAASPAGAFQYTGSAILTMTGANSYTGTTTLNNGAGTLRLDGAGLLSTGNLTVNAGTLEILATGVDQSVATLTMGGGAAGTMATINIGTGRSLTPTAITYSATNNPLGAVVGGAGTFNLGSSGITVTVGNSSNATADLTLSPGTLMGSGTLTKAGAGTLVIGPTSNNFTGTYQINAGSVIGVLSTNHIIFNGGVFEGSGSFTRTLTTTPGSDTVEWAANGGGGFAAAGGNLNVNLNPAGTLVWGTTPAFASGTGSLILGSVSADAVTTWVDDIDLNDTAGAVTRTLSAIDNTSVTTDKGILSGVLSNSNGAATIAKTGNGVLELSGANTFTGGVTVSGGMLEFSTVSNNGGGASNLGQGTDGISLGGGTLRFVGGTSQTTNRAITLTAASTLDASGTGGATITYNATVTGAFSLTLNGTGFGILNANVNQASSTTTDLIKNGSGTWRIDAAVPGLGDDILINDGVLILNVADAHDGDDLTIGAATLQLAVNGALTGTMDDLNVGTAVSGGVLDINGTTGSTPADLIVGSATTTGSVIDTLGTGSIGVTGTFALRNGTVSASLTGANALNKTTVGTVTLSGANSDFTGVTTVTQGTLILDFTTNNGEKLSDTGAGALTGNDGAVIINGNASASTSETIGGFTASGGATSITVNNGTGQTATLNLNAITRTIGNGFVNFATSSSNALITTSTTNTAGSILGGWATFGGTEFAMVSGGNILSSTSTVRDNLATWVAGEIVSDSTGYTGSTGTITIHALKFDANATSTVSINSGSVLTISSGGILVTANVGTAMASISGGTLASGASDELMVHQFNTLEAFTISSSLSGTTRLTKGGDGILVLSGNSTSNGLISILDGELRVSGGNGIGDSAGVLIKNVPGAVLHVDATTETIGNLSGGGTSGGGVVVGATGTLTIRQSSASTFSGVFMGSGTLIKTGAGTLTHDLDALGTSDFSGTFRVDQGQVTMSGAVANLASVTSIVLNGPTSVLRLNNDQNTAVASRINDSANVILNNTAGALGFSVARTAGSTTGTEILNGLTLGAGHNTLSADGTATDRIGKIQFNGTLTRNNLATMLVLGRRLGESADQRGVITIAADPGDSVGGGGAADSSTINIFPYIVGESSTGAPDAAAHFGNSFVRYTGATNGFKPLKLDTEYVVDQAGANGYDVLLGAGVVTNNVRFVTSTTGALAADTTGINSLVLDSAAGITVTGPAQALEITSGAVLSAGAGANVINGFTSITTGSSRPYYVYVTNPAGTLTLTAALTTTQALVKSGAGTLALTNTGNLFTEVYFNQGFVQVDNLDKLGSATLNFFGGGIKLAPSFAGDVFATMWNFNTGGASLDVGLVTGGYTMANGLSNINVISASDAMHLFTRAAGSTGVDGQLTIQGSSTYTGTTIVRNSGLASGLVNGVILNGNTNAAVMGNLEIGNITNINDGFDAVVALGANEQIVDTASITFRGASGENAYFKLLGFSETVAGISDTTREGVIENVESSEAGVTTNGKLTVNSGSDFSYNAYLRNRGSGSNTFLLEFEKQGTGTQMLIGDRISYSGLTTISGGTLHLQGVTAWGSSIVNNFVLILDETTARTHAQDITGTGSVIKTGSAALTFAGGLNLTYQGPTTVSGGTMTVGSVLNGSTSFNVINSGSALALTGGLGNAASITNLVVENGATLSLLDGAGNQLTGLTNLQLGSLGGTMTTLNLNVGDGGTAGDNLNTDLLALGAGGTLSLFAGNQITLNLTDAGLNPGETYTLITDVDGGLLDVLTGSDWVLGSTPGGFTSITLNKTGGAISITTGTLITGALYWRGLTNTMWNGDVNNWSQDKAGTVPATSIPGQGTDVIFQWDAPSNSAVTTTLEQNFKINSLTFEASSTPANTPVAVTINPGVLTTSRLEIAPQVATDGIEITTGGPAAVTIGAALRLGNHQTWDVAAGSLLTISGSLLGEADVTKNGTGKVILSTVADPTFNTGLTTDFTINAGILELTNAGALGTAASSNAANVVINAGGVFYFNNATAGTVATDLVLGGGTLSGGGANHTYSGAVNISGSSFINMADSNGPGTNTARNITLSGIVSGSGGLTVSSNTATLTGGNPEGGTFLISNASSTWSGPLTLTSGTVDIGVAASPTVIPSSVTFDAFGRLIVRGVDGQTYNQSGTMTFTAGTIGEYLLDNTSATLAADFVVNQNGQVNIGSGGTGASARFTVNDAATTLNINGNVILGGNSSISVDGGDADSFTTISGVISDGGAGYALAINDDAGGWAVTNDIIRLTGLNTFTGNISLAEGALEFNTVTNASGGASALGNGTAISLGGGILRFVGSSNQSTNRAISTTASSGLAAAGTGGATITYFGAISQAANNVLTLSGPGEGLISGGITQTAGTGDLSVASGTWTVQDSNVSVGDDLLMTGGTLILQNMVFTLNDDVVVTAGTLNLNNTGILIATNPGGTSSGLHVRNGGTINLNADNVWETAGGIDFINVGDATAGTAATLDTNTFNLTSPGLLVGNIAAGLEGHVVGSGTITVTSTAIDHSLGIRTYRGLISANLAGVASLLKQGLGEVTLSGDNSGLTGTVAATRFDAGNLVLDYTTQNNNKISDSVALDMRGGTLILHGNNAAATTQSVSSFTLGGGGANSIVLNNGTGSHGVVLHLNAMTRAVNAQDGTLRIVLPSGTQSATNGGTTDTLNTLGVGANAILGGWVTVDDGTGVFFARNATNAVDGNIVAAVTTLQDAVGSWVAGENISDSTGFTGLLGLININSLRFNAAAGSDLTLTSSGVLGITSGGLLITDNVGGTPGIFGGTIFSGAQVSDVPELIITHDGSTTFELGTQLRTNSALTKAGTGTLLLSGNNTYTGYTEIQNGILQLSGGHAIGDISLVTLSDDKATTLQLLDDETIGRLQGGSASSGLETLATVDLGGFTLTINQSASTTYAGRFTGTGSIVMNTGNTGNLSVTNSSTGFTGSVVVNGGLFLLGGASGRIDASSFTINKGGNLLLDNDDNASITTRVLDTASIVLNSADGAFSGQTRPRGLANRENDDVNSTETYGTLVLNSGASYVSLEPTNTGTSTQAGLTAATGWTRSNSATINVRGINLGVASGRRAQFKVANANDTAMIAANVGGGGTIGGTAKNVSIVPWAIGENLTAALADANMGNTFLSYVDDRGFVPLHLTNEFATFAAAASGDNVRESRTTDLVGIAGATINSLILHNNNTGDSTVNISGSGAGQTLAVTSGALLFTLNATADASSVHAINLGGFDSGITVGATNEYIFHVVNPSSAAATPTLTVTISSNLATLADITKSGRGTLVLSGSNSAGGPSRKVTINEGILEIASDLNNIGGNTGALVFAGGTLRLGTGYNGDISSRTITFLLGGGTIDTNGVDLALANSLGSGVGGFTKKGAGNLTLHAVSTFTGDTTVAGGTLTVSINNATGVGNNLNIIGGGTLDLQTAGLSITHGLVTTSGASPLITGNGTINASTGFFFNHTGDTTIDAFLAGAGGLLKAQSNTVTLSGDSTYTGTTEIQNGTLSINSIANVGGGASALGAPITVETGIIRMGFGTAAATLAYTGTGHISDRLIGMQGTTGGVVLDADGTGALILTGGVRFENGGDKTLTLRGSSDAAIENSIGGLTELGGILTLNKADANTWLVNGGNTYSGVTQIDDGILKVGVTDALPTGTAVRLGTGTTAGTLDLNGFNQTVGSLTVETNSDAVTNQIIVDFGNTLTINGAVAIGAAVEDGNTNLNVLGGGSILVNSNNANFIVGTATGTANTRVDVDFTGLSSFTANLGAGFFRLGDPNTDTETNPSTMKLAVDNTITASAIRIGDGTGSSTASIHTLTLGSGSNLFNADTVNIGSAGANIRSSGAVVFDALDTTGTLTIRASNGIDRAVVNLINTTGNTAGNMESTLNLAGHNADIFASTLTMATRSQNSGAATATLTFDQGTLDVATLNMAQRTSASSSGNATATMNLGDSTAPGTPTTTIGTLNMAVNTSAGGTVIADFNVTGGTVVIGTGSGTAINMANAGSGRTVTSTINLTGGTTTVTGNIVRTGGAGTENATVTLNGGMLNMSGNSIGTAGQSIMFAVQSGTLSNLGEFNGGGALTKTTAGTLVMTGANSYTGVTTIAAGILQADSSTALGSGGDITFTGGTLQFTANSSGTDWSTRFKNSTGAVAIDTNDENVTFAGVIDSSNTGGFSKSGNGTVTLSGINTFTGTIVNNGIGGMGNSSRIAISSDDNLGHVNNAILFDGTSNPDLQFTASMTLAATRTVTVNAAGGGEFLLNGGVTVDYGGVISGDKNFRKSGGGTLYLTGTNSDFSGNVIVLAGTLQVAQLADVGLNSSIGVGNNFIQVGNGNGASGTLEYLGVGSTNNRQIRVGGGTNDTNTAGANILNNGTGALVFTNAAFTDVQTNADAAATRVLKLGGANTGANEVQGVIADNGAAKIDLAKEDAGNWILSGANTYTGVSVITGGTLQVGNGGTTGNLGTGDVTADATLAFNRSDAHTVVNNIGGGGVLNQSGAGMLTLAGINTFTGVINVDAGTTLKAGSTAAFGPADVTVTATGLLILDGFSNSIDGLNGAGVVENANATGVTLTLGAGDQATADFSGIIRDGAGGGALALTKSGAGTQVLSGANTYTGATTVDTGRLDVTGSVTSAITVNAGAILGGEGSTSGLLTLQSGARIAVDGTTGGAFTSVGLTTSATIFVDFDAAPTGSGDITILTYGAGYAGDIAHFAIGNGLTVSGRTPVFMDTGSAIILSSGFEAKVWNGGINGNWNINTTANWTGGDSLFFNGDFVTFNDTATTKNVVIDGADVRPTTVAFTNTTGAANDYTISSAAAETLAAIGGISVTGSGNVTINSVIADPLTASTAVALSGGGSVTTLNGVNTFTGGVTVSDGATLVGGNNQALGATSQTTVLTISNGGTFDVNGLGDGTREYKNYAAGSIVVSGAGVGGNGAIVNNGSTAIDAFGDELVFAGDVTLGGGGRFDVDGTIATSVSNITVTKKGASYIQWNGNNSGASIASIVVMEGQLVGNNNNAFGSANIEVQSGAFAGIANNRVLTNNFTLTGGTLRQYGNSTSSGTYQGTIAVNANSVIDPNNNTQGIIIDGTLTSLDNTIVVTLGNGTTSITANAVTTGFTGEISLNQSNTTFQLEDGVTFGGKLRVGGSGTNKTFALAAGAASATFTGNLLLVDNNLGDTNIRVENGGTLTFSGNIANDGNGSGIDIVGDGTAAPDGTVIFTGTNTYGGRTLLQGETTLQIGNGGTTGTLASDVQLTTADTKLVFNRSDAYEYAGVISQTGSVQQTGAGTTVLSGVNTYSGTTTVAAGTLQVGNGTSGSLDGTGTVTVNSGAKLSGSGSIAGSSILDAGAFLAPGTGDTNTSNQTLTFTAASTSLTVNNTAQIQLGVTSADQIDGSFASWFQTNSSLTAADYVAGTNGGAGNIGTWNDTPAVGAHDFISAADTILLGTSAATDKRIAVSLNNPSGLALGGIINLLDWSTLGTKDGTTLSGMGTGAFNVMDNLQLEDLTGGLVWDTSLFNSHGILVIVPEPSRALFLLLGLLGLMLRRRRR